MKKIRATLDWSRLLGFDQAVAQRDAPDRMGKMGDRPAVKLSVKPGIKPQFLPASKVGRKVPNGSLALGVVLTSKVGSKNTVRSSDG